MSKRSSREFYKSVKAMRLREESIVPTEAVMDLNGTLLYKETAIKVRWAQYIQQLLNPNTSGESQQKFQPRFKDDHEPDILESETRRAIKKKQKQQITGNR